MSVCVTIWQWISVTNVQISIFCVVVFFITGRWPGSQRFFAVRTRLWRFSGLLSIDWTSLEMTRCGRSSSKPGTEPGRHVVIPRSRCVVACTSVKQPSGKPIDDIAAATGQSSSFRLHPISGYIEALIVTRGRWSFRSGAIIRFSLRCFSPPVWAHARQFTTQYRRTIEGPLDVVIRQRNSVTNARYLTIASADSRLCSNR